MSKIGLIDVDSHNYPNLALMKISAYEKSKGNDVEWCLPLKEYDKVYQSKVFDSTYSKDIGFIPMAKEVIRGGIGYGMYNNLPSEIEHIVPDYSLYDITDTAYGYLTRGCPRHCKFCVVGDKEGLVSHKVASLNEFWDGQKNIEILDPNLLASKEYKECLIELADSGAKVNFNQGLDIRFMTEEKAELLNKVKTSMIHFAWDNYEEHTYELLKKFRPMFDKNGRNMRVYVLTNFNTTMSQDLDRIYRIRDLDYEPFVMVYDKPNAARDIKRMQRWCNNKFIFRSCKDFRDYK